jgi:hypothetical protein
MVPLYSKLGSEYADDVLKYGQEYLELFPNGKARTDVQNCVNQARAEGAKARPASVPKPEAPVPQPEAPQP